MVRNNWVPERWLEFDSGWREPIFLEKELQCFLLDRWRRLEPTTCDAACDAAQPRRKEKKAQPTTACDQPRCKEKKAQSVGGVSSLSWLRHSRRRHRDWYEDCGQCYSSPSNPNGTAWTVVRRYKKASYTHTLVFIIRKLKHLPKKKKASCTTNPRRWVIWSTGCRSTTWSP